MQEACWAENQRREAWRLGLGSDSAHGSDNGARLITGFWLGDLDEGGHPGPTGWQ